MVWQGPSWQTIKCPGRGCSLHQVQYACDYADRIVGLSLGRVKFDLSVANFGQEAFDQLYGMRATSSEVGGMSA